MKTHHELSIEARRMEALGRQYSTAYRQDRENADAFSPAVYPPRELMTFPEPPSARNDGNPVPRSARRWVEVAMVSGSLEYRLFQAEVEPTPAGGRTVESEPEFILGSDSAFDVLEEGYRLTENERIGEAITPFAERLSDEEAMRTVDPALVEEIENIVGAEDLTPAERMRSKADIIAFLEGRLEPSEFIAAAVERHGNREVRHERLVESRGERLLMDEP